VFVAEFDDGRVITPIAFPVRRVQEDPLEMVRRWLGL
jgi:hypothetical protein